MLDKSTGFSDFASQIEALEFAFSDALAAEGFGDHHIPADGEWHDFAFPDSRRRKKNGAAKLTPGKDGVVIDRRNGKQPIFVWKSDATPLTPEQQQELARHNAQRAAEQQARQEAARQKAVEGFARYAEATPDHPYLKEKGITNMMPLRLSDDWLVVPIYNAGTGELQTLQTISPTGKKQFLKDGVSRGGCVMPGYLGLDGLDVGDDPILVAEGYATAEAVHRATKWPALAAMDCGNLTPVAEAMRRRFPKRQIVLAADNDDAGKENAARAAKAVGGTVAMPERTKSDFSDLLRDKGPEAVAVIIKAAISPEPPEQLNDHNDLPPDPQNSNATPPRLVLDPVNPLQIAKALLRAKFTQPDGLTKLHRHRGSFWQWTGSYFREVDEEATRSAFWGFLEGCFKSSKDQTVPFKPKASQVSEAVDALNAVTQLDRYIEPPSWLTTSDKPPPTELLACANGLLHLPSGEMYPASPDFFNLNASEVIYDPDAPYPKQWHDLLNQIFEDDTEAKDLLQDWFGYVLAPDTSLQKIMLVVGPKRSGKGTIGRVLTELLGRDSVAGPTMSALGEQFGLEPLITKPLAIVSDARIGRRTDKSTVVERLLSISGEDALTVGRKYKSAWTGRLPSRFMILTNELPSLNDGSGALAGRFIILMMTKSFYGQEDPTLTSKLLSELSGILNWAIEGYRRLRQRQYFVQPESSKDAEIGIEMLASPVKAFIRECCDTGPAFKITTDHLWLEWQRWADEQGLPDAGSKIWFSRNLHSALPGLRISKTLVDDEREPIFVGVRIKPDRPTPGPFNDIRRK